MIAGKPRVLVVDDDPTSLAFLQAAISRCGCNVVAAGSFAAALAATPGQNPGLLLIDRRLPDGDAIALLGALRGLGIGAPAVATSADLDARTRDLLLAGGFVDSLCKPAGLDAIGRLLRRFLPVGPEASVFTLEREPARAPRQLLDDAAALAAIGGDRAALRELRRMLAAELGVMLNEFNQGRPGTTGAGLADRLHRLRASCGFCGAPLLAAAAERLERTVQGGNDDHPAARDAFIQACIKTIGALPLD